MESKEVIIPAPNYENYEYRYWEIAGGFGDTACFVVQYTEKATRKTKGVQTEMLVLNYEGESKISTLSSEIKIGHNIHDIRSREVSYSYYYFLDETNKLMYFDLVSEDEKGVELLCFDLNGDLRWKQTQQFILDDVKIGLLNSNKFWMDFTVYNEQLLGFYFVQPWAETIQSFFYDSENGELHTSKTYSYVRGSNNTFYMANVPGGKGYQELLEVKSSTKKEKDLAEYDYFYFNYDDEEVIFIRTDKLRAKRFLK